MTMIELRRHNCYAAHRTNRTLAKCMFPQASWIHGTGEYATLSWCRGNLTIVLWDDSPSAKGWIASGLPCGHACTANHELIHLVRSDS